MPTLNLQVNQNTDDCQRWKENDYFDHNGVVPFGYYSAATKAFGGAVRFRNVTIPKNATITAAYLTFTALSINGLTTVNARIQAQDADNPSTFSDQADFDARSWGSAIDWDDVGAWASLSEYNSPSLISIVQTLVNRTNWASGQAMVFAIQDWDKRSTQTDNTYRVSYGHNTDPTRAAKLHIEYTPARVTIATVPVVIKRGSLSISKPIEERKTASFIVIDSAGTADYTRGQAVSITSGATVIFAGAVEDSEKSRLSPDGGLWHKVRCIDNHYLAGKRIAAESYENKTAGFVVDDLFDKYLAAEGVTIGSIQTGPTLEQVIVNYVFVSDAFDALAEKAGFIWYIDETKALYFIDRATNTASWALTASDIVADSARLTNASPMYRNRQYIRGGRQVTAQQTENRTGDGDTVAFAMGYPLNSTPTITVGGAAQTVGIKGVDDAVDWYWAKGDPIVTAASAPAGAAAIVVVYYGEYDIMVQMEDTPEINARKAAEGGTGIVEGMENQPSLSSLQSVFDLGIALLAEYGVTGRKLIFKTRRSGLDSGQILTVTISELGLTAEEMLIDSVNISVIGDEVRYSVTAIQGPALGSWSQFFKSLAKMKDDIFGRLNIGSDQVLIILASVPENWALSESITKTVYACDVPATNLYPSLTRYPC